MGSNYAYGCTMKALLVCDNRDVPNWGCRATSIALHRLLSKHFDVFATVGRKDVIRTVPLGLPMQSKLVRGAIKHAGMAGLATKAGFRTDYVDGDIEGIVKRVIDHARHNAFFADLVEKFSEADIVVINGEGSMVFKPIERKDLRFQLFSVAMARHFNKPAFYVNAMVSEFPGSAIPTETLEKSMLYLERCAGVQLRDLHSLAMVQKHSEAHAVHAPDALFSWLDSDYLTHGKLSAGSYRFFPPFPEFEDRIGWNFDEPYICVGGTSYIRANGFDAGATSYFGELAERLKGIAQNLYLVVTCTGDNFLHEVGRSLDIPVIPVETNIFAGARILGNAKAFVSGRYHPAILASLGGTPCVFFESNSHKTRSLQELLQYERPVEYSLRDKTSIEDVVRETTSLLSAGDALRQTIRDRACQLSREASSIPDFIRSSI